MIKNRNSCKNNLLFLDLPEFCFSFLLLQFFRRQVFLHSRFLRLLGLFFDHRLSVFRKRSWNQRLESERDKAKSFLLGFSVITASPSFGRDLGIKDFERLTKERVAENVFDYIGPREFATQASK